MWQLLTLAILLALMIGLEDFNLVSIEDYLGEAPPFTPKSLAATGFIILAAFTTGELFKRFKIPALLGYIAAGIIFGPQLIEIIYQFLLDYLPSVASALYGDRAPRALFSAQVINDLALINVLTVGVIGTMGGGELKISDIKESWKLILATVSLMVITSVPLTVGAVMALPYIPIELAGFLKDVSTPSRLGAALLFGILAVAMSPAATLAIIQETRAKGKFTSLALGIVVVADLVLVALFLVGYNISKLLVAPEGFSASKLAEALPGIGLEFGWAFVIGAVTGLIFILYMRYVQKEMMLFTVGMIFAASFLSKVLHAETLLAFLTAGFIVQNFSKHGHDLIHELEKISTPVFIVYFMTQAAKLDIMGVVAYLPLTLLLAALRAGSYYLSARIATKKLQTDEVTQRWLWLSFLSRGGVDLVLADMVAGTLTGDGSPLFAWGTDFQTVVMGTVVVHIVAGPPLLKLALGKVGETEEARQAEDEPEANGDSTREDVVQGAEFLVPELESRVLNERLLEMREHLISLHSEHIEQPLLEQRSKLEESARQVQQDIVETLNKLEGLLENTERYDRDASLKRAITSLYTQSRRKLQPSIQLWEKLEPVAIDARSASAVILEVQNFESFDSQFVVDLEEELYNPQTAQGLVRLARRVRSIQRTIVGPLRRNVPLGKLWRYYVELSLPRYLERAASRSSRSHEIFWFELGRYLERFDAIFRIVLEELETPAKEEVIEVEPADEATSSLTSPFSLDDEDEELVDHDHHEDHHGHEEEGEADPHNIEELRAQLDPQQEPRERALEFLRLASARHGDNARELEAHLGTWLKGATQEYSWSMQESYATLVEAAMRAGTIELPGPAYRPSTKFDDARRAEAQLREHLEAERVTISAYIGWIVVDHQLALFSNWFAHYQQRIIENPTSFFEEKYIRQLRTVARRSAEALERLGQMPEDDPDAQKGELPIAWEEWYRKEVLPTTRGVQRALERELTQILQGVASRRLIDALEYRVASFSERVTLLRQDPHLHPPSSQRLDTAEIKVRSWFSKRLVSEVSLRYIEFNERIQRLIRRNQVTMESFMQALQEPLVESPEVPASLDDLLERLHFTHDTATQLAEVVTQDLEELEEWATRETSELLANTARPFTQHQLQEVERNLGRSISPRERFTSSGPVSRFIAPPLNWAFTKYEVIAPLYEEFVEDFRHLLSDDLHATNRNVLRERLRDPRELAHAQSLPVVYKRLFNPVPLDLPEFYVERPELEARCLRAIAEWGQGKHHAILLKGERGIGKRTFVHNLVPLKVYDLEPIFQQTPIETISLPEDAHNEQDLCRAFSVLFPSKNIQSFEQLTTLLHDMPTRQVLIVENAIKAYTRTHEGIELCRRFLDMLNHTSDRVLWIVLMDTPAATLLDTMLDIQDYFTHTFDVEPFSNEGLEEMIMNRHRVSGFDVTYDLPNLRLLQRTRHPFAASEIRRNPKRDFFRRLSVLSHGNPLQALMLWFGAIRLDEQLDTCIRVMPLPEEELVILEALTLNKRLILATLLQHGTLTAEQLVQVLGLSARDVEIELDHLERLGLLEGIVSTYKTYRVPEIAAVNLTHELRHMNLI